MKWRLSDRFDPIGCQIADRHYNRQKIGSPQFVPPGRCLVLLHKRGAGRALWVTSWPFAEYVKHAWPGAWINSLFRREGGALASVLIRDAVAATREYYGDPPALGMVTFINREKVIEKAEYGKCYLEAGFEVCGETKGGLLALQMKPCRMPGPKPALGTTSQLSLLSTIALGHEVSHPINLSDGGFGKERIA